jgi:ethanolamine utilization cobalamin adenosyltransferase
MRFITEEELRDKYRKEPFTTFQLEEGARLTPGARQFLSDRGISMAEGVALPAKGAAKPNKMNEREKKKLGCMMKSAEAIFLMAGEELLKGDQNLAQSVIELGKQFTAIRNAFNCGGTADSLCCKECTGINEKNFSQDLDDCFEITDEHIQLKKGRDIVLLHRLRCSLRELEAGVLEMAEGRNEESGAIGDLVGKLNQIINTLSQTICSVVGGKTCQRKC